MVRTNRKKWFRIKRMVKEEENGSGGREWFRRKRMFKEERRAQEVVYC